jgi:hypothetical protein
LLGRRRLRGVELAVAFFDAAGSLMPGKDDADVVWAGAFACSSDFLLCNSLNLI